MKKSRSRRGRRRQSGSLPGSNRGLPGNIGKKYHRIRGIKGMPVYSKTFTPQDNKTLGEFKIPVAEGTEEILIRGDYHPRAMNDAEKSRRLVGRAVDNYLNWPEDDPLLSGADWKYYQEHYRKNIVKWFPPIYSLFNYTLIDPNGLIRGRGNNRFFDVVQIGRERASIGCVPGVLPVGDWRLMVEAHAVLSASVMLHMEVAINRTFTPGIAATEKGAAELRELTELRGAARGETFSGPGWFGGDLHVHSHHSDGDHSVPELMGYLKAKGLDFFCLSDHNTTLGWRKEYLSEILVIPGIEVSTFFGHFVLIDWTGDVDWFSLGRQSNLRDVAAEAKKRGTLFSVAHPACIDDPICMGCRWNYPRFDWASADLMEVWAGSWSERRAENIKTLKRWEDLINRGLKVVAVSGSDIHQLEPYKKDYGRTYVWAETKTRTGIIEGLRKGKVYISCGPEIDFWLETAESTVNREGDGRPSVSVGETLTLRGTGDLRLLIRIVNKKDRSGQEKRLRIALLKNGLPCHVWERDSEETILEYPDKVTGDAWYYLRILDETSCMLAMTNPIFIKISKKCQAPLGNFSGIVL